MSEAVDLKETIRVSDIAAMRRHAREHVELGAITADYEANRETVIRKLNEALATGIVGMLRYKRHHFMAAGIHAEGIVAQFLKHADEELQHADRVAQRIVQLNGKPNFSPNGLAARSHAEYVEGESLTDMIREDLIAERIAIESHRSMINYIGDSDPTTRRLLESILAVEEEHANDLVGVLGRGERDNACAPHM